jgi:glycosyltransferase involved in cell wall biosynthesis
MRLAWFTPLPPVRSGIAAYNAELLPFLASRHAIDVFTEPAPPGDGRTGEGSRLAEAPRIGVFGAHDFVWKHDRNPYDLIVYQLGNAACHDFMWPHLARYPGLVVLHDGQVHHERSRALLSRGRVEDYRAEFRYNHPEAPEHLPDLVISALGGSLYYVYPMLRWIVRTARLVVVHGEGLASEIRTAYPGVEVRTVRHGMIDPVRPGGREAASAVRRRHGVPDAAVLFAAFGLVTPEKRVSAILRGFARTIGAGIDAYLLLAGGAAGYYDAAAEAAAHGVSERVRITGYVPDEELAAHVLAADVCLCLRWPTSHETSGTWIRAIGAGRPTVITDLAHTTEVPSLDPRTWLAPGTPVARDFSPVGVEASVADPTASSTPVSIAVDLLDETETLSLAMARLATDAGLRDRLGRNGRDYWEAHHTMAGATQDYLGAIERASARPAPRVRDLPPHLLQDHTGLARTILAEMGIEPDLFR